MRSLALALLLCGPFVPVIAGTAHAAFELSPPRPAVALSAVGDDVASNGRGFLALFRSDYSAYHTALMPLDGEGRPTREVARFASHRDAAVVRLGDHYLLSWIDERGRRRLSEVSQDGEFLAAWGRDFVPRYAIELYASTSGHRILIVDRTGSRAFLFSEAGVLLRTIDLSGLPQTLVFFGGPDRFIWTTVTVEGTTVFSIDGDGADLPVRTVPGMNASWHTLRAIVSADRIVFAFLQQAGQGAYDLRTATLRDSSVSISDPLRIETNANADLGVWELLATPEGLSLIVRRDHRQGTEPPRLLLYRLRLDGTLLRPDAETITADAGPVRSGAAATNGDRIVVLTSEPSPPGSKAIAISFTAGSLPAMARETVSRVRIRQVAPHVANSGIDSLVVWQEQTAEGSTLRARKLTPGAGLAGEPFAVSQTDGGFGKHTVAFGGGVYLVVWHHWQQLWAARVDSAGRILDAEPILIRDSIRFRTDLAVASDGQRFLITWTEDRNILGAFIALDGSVGSVSPLYEPPTGGILTGVSDHGIAWDGSSYLLVWTRSRSSGFPGYQSVDVRATFVSSDGMPERSSELGLGPGMQPKVAGGDGVSLVTWQGLAALIVRGATEPAVFRVGPFVYGGSQPQFDGADFLLTHRAAPDQLVLARINPHTSVIRRTMQITSDLSLPATVAVSTGGNSSVIAEELRGDGSEAPMWRIMVYPDQELVPMRRRGAGF